MTNVLVIGVVLMAWWLASRAVWDLVVKPWRRSRDLVREQQRRDDRAWQQIQAAKAAREKAREVLTRELAVEGLPPIDWARLERGVAQPCQKAPPGWLCTRLPHDGPCAAVPDPRVQLPEHEHEEEDERYMGARYPHCDDQVLHAPGECQYCDGYPKRQAGRARAGFNYTGKRDPSKLMCPSETRRDLRLIERWPGNRAKP